jgi:hypothetical protein
MLLDIYVWDPNNAADKFFEMMDVTPKDSCEIAKLGDHLHQRVIQVTKGDISSDKFNGLHFCLQDMLCRYKKRLLPALHAGGDTNKDEKDLQRLHNDVRKFMRIWDAGLHECILHLSRHYLSLDGEGQLDKVHMYEKLVRLSELVRSGILLALQATPAWNASDITPEGGKYDGPAVEMPQVVSNDKRCEEVRMWAMKIAVAGSHECKKLTRVRMAYSDIADFLHRMEA